MIHSRRERVDNKEGPKRDSWISLGRGNRNLLRKLEVGGGLRGNLKEKTWWAGWRMQFGGRMED